MSSAIIQAQAAISGETRQTPCISMKVHKYQKLVMASKARFRVVVAGRRWGKCLASGTKISMADGTERPVEQVEAGDWVLTVNQDSYEIEPRQVMQRLDNGVKETVEVKTSGRTLRVTPNHPVLANNLWVEAGDLKSGDLVAVPRATWFGDQALPDHELVLLALWLAEGSDYTITSKTPEIVEEMKIAARAIGIEPASKDGLNWRFFDGNRTGGPICVKNPLRALLTRHEVWGLNSKTKRVPEAIFRLPEPQLARFLNLFMACDGSISKRSKSTWSLEVGLAGEDLVRDIARLFHKFGIRGQIRHKIHKAPSSRTGQPFESWALVVSDGRMLVRFADHIGALSKERQVDLARLSGALSAGSTNDLLPVGHDELKGHLVYETRVLGLYDGHNATISRGMPDELRQAMISWRKQTPERITRRRYEQLRGFTDGYFDPIADGDLVWEEVKSVTAAGEVQTWDLALPDNHNFFAEGFVTHNTQVSKISLILAAAKKRKQIVWYVAPTYQQARDILWEDLKASVPKSWMLAINETRMSIRFINGSRVHLKGADKPDSLRGVGLHFVVIDEAQDIKEETWELVLQPTLATTNGKAIFIGTPKSYNWLYYKYMLGQRGDMVPDVRGRMVKNEWESWQFPTMTSPFIPRKEIAARKRDMDPKSFAQEFNACHLPETEVVLWDGSIKAISQIEKGSIVRHLNEYREVIPAEVLAIGETGEKIICDVVLETGEVISASAHHKFKVYGNAA